ncbi:PREDICTED: putative GPI-anchored protein PB15E9.01c, partial [Rhagoletis zephyria]|uniref:putative GPI-anchored protein PB15E9.01c n=1 Tax=Rhagoletis zephyria TaxID=28612 RepID=UPI000811329B
FAPFFQCDNLLFADVEDDANVEDDVDNVATAALPPVAATRSTLTTHYATAKPIAVTTPSPTAVRSTPPANCIEQRLPAFKAHHSDNAATTANVQAVLLQNQVNTLQWQLKQVETSNEMYRAVIEEIARFLDRYQTQKQLQRQLQQQQQISRSKSLYQVYDGSSNCEGHEQNTSGNSTFSGKSTATSSCLRTRSSSNLIVDLKQSAIQNGNVKSNSANGEHSTLATSAADKRSCDAINTSANNSYTAFKDFTWRRSPKKYAESKAQAAADDVEEKLNQEAFRLSRTIHNLLNTSTRQPDLTQHRSSLTTHTHGVHSKVLKTPAPSPAATIPTLVASAAQGNATSKKHSAADATNKCNSRVHPAANSLANATAEMLFLRANNIRDSRLSLRSSTDSSVHSTTSNSSAVSSSSSSASSSAASTSSSKVETDEDVTLNHPFHAMALPFKQLQHPLGSATEDESGFSSISSFQDIGVPLCSTMISNGTSTPNRLSLASVKFDTTSLGNANGGIAVSVSGDMEAGEFAGDSRNSTLKANHPSNVLGVPLQATHDMQHRWDTTTTTTTKTSYRSANTYQRFSTLSNEDASAVLWV